MMIRQMVAIALRDATRATPDKWNRTSDRTALMWRARPRVASTSPRRRRGALCPRLALCDTESNQLRGRGMKQMKLAALVIALFAVPASVRAQQPTTVKRDTEIGRASCREGA